MLNILSIETSCDETAAAVVCDHSNPSLRIKSNIIFSQIQEHIEYAGVVPELAARAHLIHIRSIIEKALLEAQCVLEKDINALAVTSGPGLIGGVIIGVTVAKAIAMACNLPIIGVNHLEGHALTVRLTHDIAYPYLLLLVSGGHCQFVAVEELGKYRVLGSTLDDSAGEAFDKVAKMLNAGYPGGPAVEKYALQGTPCYTSFLPKPLVNRNDGMMSFSGLKTAMRLLIQKEMPCEDEGIKANLCASFQKAVADHLCDKTKQILKTLPQEFKSFVVAGGVASNVYICNRLKEQAEVFEKTFVAPPLKLCTDNAAMIGWAGIERYKKGLFSSLDFTPKPRWPLENL